MVWILAGYQDPEATWSDPEELAEALRLERFPDGVLDELIGLRWLDRNEDGALSVHDWDAHQYAASASIGRAWQAANMREWRKQRPQPDDPPPAPPSLVGNNNKDKTLHNRSDDTSQHVMTAEGNEVVKVYQELYGQAGHKKELWLRDIARRWEVGRVVEALRREKERGTSSREVCGNLQNGLTAGDIKAGLALVGGTFKEETTDGARAPGSGGEPGQSPLKVPGSR